MRLAVVGGGGGVGLEGHLELRVAVGHDELALGLADFVVAEVGALLRGDGEGVGLLAHEGLGVVEGVGRALVLDPAGLRGQPVAVELRRGGHALVAGVGVGERLAVVGLGEGGRGEGQRGLVDDEGAVLGLDSGRHAVIKYFAFGIVDDNISAGLGRKSVLSCVLYLAVLCALIGNDRRIAGDIEGFRADLNPDALLTVSARNRLYTLKSDGVMVLPIVSEAVRLSNNGEGVLNGLPLRDIGRISSHGFRNLGVPTLESVAPSDRILDGGSIVSIKKITVGRLFRRILQRSVGKIVFNGVLDRRPLGRQGNIGLGHREDVTRPNGGLIGRFLPAGELVAGLLGRLVGDGHHIASGVERLGVRAPGAAVQLVGHDVVSHVLRIEVHILSDSVGERDIASGQAAIGAPCD